MRFLSVIFLTAITSQSDAFNPTLNGATKSITSLRMASDDEVVLNKYSR